MSTQPIYDRRVDHLPLILTRGLPGPSRQLTWPDVGPIAAADPWWDYELFDGSVWVSSTARRLTWMDLDEAPEDEELRYRPWALELIEGTLIVSPNSPTLNHQRCVLSAAILLRQNCLPELETVISPFAFSFDDNNEIHPDVLVARRPIDQDRLRQPPVLAVEVLSPSTRRTDLVKKREAFQRQGVEHYWIVEPNLPLVSLLVLDGGVYREVAHVARGERVEVTEPFQISFDPGDLLD